MAMDLKRVAMGHYRKSAKMADIFLNEAIKRKKDVDLTNAAPHIKDLLNKLEEIKDEKDKQKAGEDALMYSTLFQNASLK
jgi:hypothetical protein